MTTALILAIYLASVLAAAIIGARKGNPLGATFLGLVLGPLGLLVVLLSGNKRRTACPHCGEAVLKTASVCPHCRRDLVAAV